MNLFRSKQRSDHKMWILLLVATTTLLATVQAVPIQLHGLNYNTRQGPDWDWDKCKSRATIQTELALHKLLTNRIRILSLTDCDQGNLVTSVAKEFGMQLYLGMWVGPEDYVFEEEKGALQNMIDQGLLSDSTVLGITVGSEAIYRKDATVNELIRNMNEVYAMLQKAGLTLPVTIVDVAPVYVQSKQLREAVNFTMTNTFPFWEGIAIDGAVDDLQVDLDWLMNLPESKNKPFVLGETGWPSAGFIQGVGVAGTDEQRQYFQEAYCRMHVEKKWNYYWFTGIDNAWRLEQDPNNTIEPNWGLFYADRTLKEHFVDFEFQCSDGVTYSFAEIDFAATTDFTPAPAALDPASCQAHSQCAALAGNCCPNDTGDNLGCCGAVVPRTPTTIPAPSPTKSPVGATTISPDETRTNVPAPRPATTLSPLGMATPSPNVTPGTDQPTKGPTSGATTRTSRPVLDSTNNKDNSFPPTRPPVPTVPSSGVVATSFLRPATVTGFLLLLGLLNWF